MKREYADTELKALVLDLLQRRGRWGAHYFPLDTLVNKLSHVVKDNGKRIRRMVKELLDEGYLLVHKEGETLSLNPAKNREIIDYVRKAMRL